MVKPKPTIEERTSITDHSDPYKREQVSPEANLSLERRLQLALSVAWEIDALADRTREPLEGMISEDTLGDLVAMNAFLERMKVLADALTEVATPDDGADHDVAKLEGVLRFAPRPK